MEKDRSPQTTEKFYVHLMISAKIRHTKVTSSSSGRFSGFTSNHVPLLYLLSLLIVMQLPPTYVHALWLEQEKSTQKLVFQPIPHINLLPFHLAAIAGFPADKVTQLLGSHSHYLESQQYKVHVLMHSNQRVGVSIKSSLAVMDMLGQDREDNSSAKWQSCNQFKIWLTTTKAIKGRV